MGFPGFIEIANPMVCVLSFTYYKQGLPVGFPGFMAIVVCPINRAYLWGFQG